MLKDVFKIKYLFLIVVIIIILFIIITYHNNSNNVTEVHMGEGYIITINDDGTMSIPLGGEAYKVMDTSTQTIINLDTVYQLDNESTVRNTVSHQIHKEGSFYYELIVMVDYIQTDFYVDGELYFSYPYSLVDEDLILIDVETVIKDPHAKEIHYMIIKYPHYSDTDYDNIPDFRDTLNAISNPLYWRVRLSYDNDQLIDNMVFEENFLTIEEELFIRPISLLEVSDINDKYLGEPLETFVDYNGFYSETLVGNSNQPANILLYNNHEEASEFIVFQLLNWEQVPFDDGNMYKYFSVPPNTGIHYTLTLPVVDKNTPYHIIAFRNPYRYSIDDLQDFIEATSRTIIKP